MARASNSRKVYALVAAVTLVIAATTFGQIRLNEWQRDFYDALEQRRFDALLVQLGVFVTIIAGLLSLQVAQTWLGATLKIGLRAAVTNDLLSAWMQPRRAYQLGWAGEVGHNPDQRIHEDARHLCDLCGDLGIGLLQSTLLLVSFVGVLWVLSEHVTLVYAGYRLEIPGYMVWCAVAYAAAGSWATWRVVCARFSAASSKVRPSSRRYRPAGVSRAPTLQRDRSRPGRNPPWPRCHRGRRPAARCP